MHKRIRTRKDSIEKKSEEKNEEKQKKSSTKTVLEVLAQIGGILAFLGGCIGLITGCIGITPIVVSFIKENNNTPSIPFNSSDVNILVPLYIYPDIQGSAEWQKVIDASKKVPITVIVNPASGPGTPPSGAGSCPQSIYNEHIENLLDNGVQVIGYINTDQGERDKKQVEFDIDLYLNCYHLNGIFIEAKYSATEENLNYFYHLYWYTRTNPDGSEREPQPLVFLGAGNNPNDGYFKQYQYYNEFYQQYYIEPPFYASIIFEGASSPAWDDYTINSYVDNVHTEPPYTVALIHSTPNITMMQQNIIKAVERHINYVYVTNDVMDNPWDSLPSYWDAEVDFIKEDINKHEPATQP